MATSIRIEVHAGYEITLDPLGGLFHALVEDAPMKSATLADLRTRLSTVAERLRTQERAHMMPVSIWLYMQEGGVHKGEVVEVRGIVAGKLYPRKIRTSKGQAPATGASICVVVLHPEDSRIPVIERLFAQCEDAQQVLAQSEHAVREMLHGLPTIVVPLVQTKEDALNEEPMFLAQLRALQPVEESAR